MRKIQIFESPQRIKRKLAATGVVSVALAGVAVALLGSATASNHVWTQGFETDTSGWQPNGPVTIHREASGYTNGGGYADGIQSSEGNFHARLRTNGCTVNCSGPFTRWGKATSNNPTFPAGGYVTEIDVYLDTAWASGKPDRRFDFSSAINNASGTHLRDFAFNAGTSPTGAASFVVNASTNAGRSSSFPSNPCPSPSTPPNSCRSPETITQSGWYTFRHTFRDNGGNLAVDMEIIDTNGGTVASWTIHADPMSNVGGDRYGWFVNEEINDLAIDNAERRNRTPQSKDECKKDGWQQFDNPRFKNQGDCVSYIQTGGRNEGAG